MLPSKKTLIVNNWKGEVKKFIQLKMERYSFRNKLSNLSYRKRVIATVESTLKKHFVLTVNKSNQYISPFFEHAVAVDIQRNISVSHLIFEVKIDAKYVNLIRKSDKTLLQR